ncbi:MAG TPA: VanZ family protein [Vicinamibacterales bacterium]|nr:VanZ family protein [Vicinamibacterales bacterium]
MSAAIERWRHLAWIWGPAIALAAAIFVQSSRESVALPGRSDLLAHFAAFGTLAALVLRGCADGQRRSITWQRGAVAWLVTAAYAATDELHQRFVPGRTAALDDWIADAVGAALAVAAIVIVARMASGGGLRGREV